MATKQKLKTAKPAGARQAANKRAAATMPAASKRVLPLAERKCIPCSGKVPPLKSAEIAKLSRSVKGWSVVNNHHLERSYKFRDFFDALEYVNAVAQIAEAEDHHPDIKFGWGYAELKVYTHAIDGLTESDFILAAKINRI
jgi:4a-hydroxytetrahydrobiopterin dehydratase